MPIPEKTLQKLRKDSMKIFYAGLRAADSFEAVKKFVYRKGNLLKIGKDSYFFFYFGTFNEAMLKFVQQFLFIYLCLCCMFYYA